MNNYQLKTIGTVRNDSTGAFKMPLIKRLFRKGLTYFCMECTIISKTGNLSVCQALR